MKMSKKWLSLVAAALIAASAFAVDFRKVENTTHTIVQNTIVGSAKCSATAIGPHALLTASHCELPTNELIIDGDEVDIKKIIRDGRDHTIYVVDAKFESFAQIGKPPKTGDDVFIFGNPGALDDVLRKGYVAKAAEDGALYDLNGYYGDSGAGIFNEHGNLVGVLSAMIDEAEEAGDKDGVSMKFMSGFSLAFTPDQLAQVE